MGSVYKRADRGGKRAGKYYVQYRDHEGKVRTKATGTSDKDDARRILAKIENEVAKRASGLIDPRAEKLAKHLSSDITEQLEAYRRRLQTAGKSDEHVSQSCRIIHEVVAFCEFKALRDICPDAVIRYTTNLKTEHSRAARTIQSHLQAICGFTRWLVKTEKLPSDPLVSLDKPNPKTDRRHERRMLLPEEWTWLMRGIDSIGESYGMTTIERGLLYETAIQTGLRAGELRELSRGKLQLKSDPPYILAKPSTTKNYQTARQYVAADLAGRLGRLVNKKTGKASVFDLPPRYEMAGMLRVDLAEARRLWLENFKDPDARTENAESDFLAAKNHDDEVIDFHALRHTCGAWLAKTGAHPQVVQRIMRHSTIVLTMETYGHLFPGDEARSIDKLAAMFTEGVSSPLAATQ